jgi:hypothetical protein
VHRAGGIRPVGDLPGGQLQSSGPAAEARTIGTPIRGVQMRVVDEQGNDAALSRLTDTIAAIAKMNNTRKARQVISEAATCSAAMGSCWTST